MENLRAVQSFVDEEKIDCDLDVTHAIDVQLDEAYCAKCRAGWESLVAQGSKVSELVEVKVRENAEDVCLARFTRQSQTVGRVQYAHGAFSSFLASGEHEAVLVIELVGSGRTN